MSIDGIANGVDEEVVVVVIFDGVDGVDVDAAAFEVVVTAELILNSGLAMFCSKPPAEPSDHSVFAGMNLNTQTGCDATWAVPKSTVQVYESVDVTSMPSL